MMKFIFIVAVKFEQVVQQAPCIVQKKTTTTTKTTLNDAVGVENKNKIG